MAFPKDLPPELNPDPILAEVKFLLDDIDRDIVDLRSSIEKLDQDLTAELVHEILDDECATCTNPACPHCKENKDGV